MAKKLGAKCAVGGKITGPGGVDKVPLQATAGEYMLPVKTVQAIGVPTLDALVRQTNGKEPGPKMVAGTEHAAAGGEIGKGVVDTVKNLFGFGAALQDSQRRTREAVDGYADGGEIDDPYARQFGSSIRSAASQVIPPVVGAVRAVNDNLPSAVLMRGAIDFQRGLWGAPSPTGARNTRDLAPATLRSFDEYRQPQKLPLATENAQRAAWGAAPLPEPAVAAPEQPQQAGGAQTPQAPQAPTFVRPAPVQDTFKNTAKGGSLASFFGAAMNEKRLSQAEQVARDQAVAENAFNQKNAEIGVQRSVAQQRVAGDVKSAYEAEILRRRIALADTLKDPDARAALLVGQAPPKRKLEVPMALQPMPGSGDGQAVMFDPASGSVFRAPIKSQASMRRGSDGKTYVMGADGNPLREATPDEMSSISGQ